MAAKCTGKANLVDVGDFQLIHQQLHARIECRLRHLDGPHVVLSDPNEWLVGLIRRLANDVIERALVGFYPGAPARKCAINEAILIDDTRKVHLSDGLNDARAANAGNASLGNSLFEASLITP